MKICLIGVFPGKPGEAKGGVANVILYLALGLTAKGHEVHIISPGKKEETVNEWSDFTVHFVKTPRFFPRVLTNWTIIRRSIHQEINHIEPDICHFHGTATYMLGNQRPSVLTLHGIPELDVQYDGGVFFRLKSLLQSMVESYCRRKVKNLIIINKYITEIIGKDIKGQSWVIENPVAPIFYSLKPAPRLYVFYAGMINKRKNILGLLKAFQIVHQQSPDARLRIAGPVRDHSYMQDCQTYINKMNLKNHVDFLGSYTPQEIAKELQNVTCAILVSFQETAPLIISESMAASVPVIASDSGGVRYMIEHGKTGYITNVNDHQSMANAMLTLLNNSELTQEMGNTARQVAIKRFHIDSVVDRTLDVYTFVIEHKR